MDVKGKIHNDVLILRGFNIPLTSMDRPFRQKSNTETLQLNDSLGQVHLTDIYMTLYPKTIEHTFFSITH